MKDMPRQADVSVTRVDLETVSEAVHDPITPPEETSGMLSAMRLDAAAR